MATTSRGWRSEVPEDRELNGPVGAVLLHQADKVLVGVTTVSHLNKETRTDESRGFGQVRADPTALKKQPGPELQASLKLPLQILRLKTRQEIDSQ